VREPVATLTHERRDPMTTPSIIALMTDPKVFGKQFGGVTWAAWRTALAATFALSPSDEDVVRYRAHTGRIQWPSAPVCEAWWVVARRAGKSIIAALVAVYLAVFRRYRLAAGEVGVVMILATDRRQARVIMGYIAALLDGVPMLARLIAHRTAESLTLTNGITIEIHTSNFRAVRGYTIVAAVCDEIAFWSSDNSANPDTEVLAAIRPAMATVPNALLLCISSAYARRGALYEAHRQHFGKDGDPVLVWQADTRSMNPTVDERVIAAAYSADPASARAEYGGLFRTDVEDFVDVETVERAVIQGRHEVSPALGRHRYVGFCDPAGGSGSDSMTLAIAHNEGGKVVLDHLTEIRPPFSPEAAVEHFAAVLARWNLRKATSDRYAGSWPVEQFKKRSVTLEPSEKTKSEIYAAFLPMLNSNAVELLDDKRLIAQLLGLERRTAWGGKDSVDHRPGAHDDLINAAAGALVLVAAARPRPLVYVPDGITRIGEPAPARVGIVGQAPLASRGEVGGQARFVMGSYTPRWFSHRR
jgi:hypothetical protein